MREIQRILALDQPIAWLLRELPGPIDGKPGRPPGPPFFMASKDTTPFAQI
jgi:hypothetical protein